MKTPDPTTHDGMDDYFAHKPLLGVMAERRPPDPKRFVELATMTLEQLNQMTNQQLRDLHSEINVMWNFCLYPTAVATTSILYDRNKPERVNKTAPQTDADRIAAALTKSGLSQKDLKDFLSSLNKLK